MISAALLSPQAFVAPSGAALSSKVHTSHIVMESYGEYLARRNGGYAATATPATAPATAFEAPVALPKPTVTYADYLRGRATHHAAPAAVAHVAVPAPTPAAPSAYEEYLASRNTVGYVAPVEVPAPVAEAPSMYEQYLASRTTAPVEAAPAPVEIPTPAPAPLSMYEQYLASRDAAPAAAPAEAAAVSMYSDYLAGRNAAAVSEPVKPWVQRAAKSPDYDPWADDELTLVPLTVHGVTKHYRIKH